LAPQTPSEDSATVTVVRTQRARPVGGWREEFATIAGRVVILGGLWSIVSIVFRPVRWVHWVDQAFGLLNLPVSPSIFSVTLLLVLGGALQRRKRISVWVLLVFQSVALAGVLVVNGVLAASSGHVDGVRPMDIVLIELGGAISAVLIVLLWRSRSAFPARLQSGAFRRAVVVLVSGLALSIGLSVFLTMLFPGHLHTVGRKVMWAIRSAIGLEPDREEAGWHLQYGHHWITAVTGTLSALALIAAILVFLRSASSASRLSAQDELDVRGLLLRHGERDSLGYFATRHDKAAVFSPDHQAAVTFRAVASVSLASGDPIGASSAWPAAIDAWLARSQESGWLPAVLSASADGAQAYVAAGLKALPLGDEAIIDLDTFTLH
jgi:lysyl-tRNA synthetase class 2